MIDTRCTDEITGIALNSRDVKPGMLFAALPGSKVDGRDYIAQAIAAGATHILAPAGTMLPDNGAVLIEVADVRAALAHMAAAYYKAQPARVVAVTGTNGKTSTAIFASQIWDALAHTGAALGTLGVVSRRMTREGALTTPDSVQLHVTLADMAKAGIDRLAMEASSIGIEQRRMDGVMLAAAAYTNLTQDHLDYHGDMDAYYLAKQRLFDVLLPEGAPAIVYADDAGGQRLIAHLKAQGRRVITYGQGGHIGLVSQTPVPDGQILEVSVDGRHYAVRLKLPGLFQALNVLCAAAIVMAVEGIGFDAVLPYLERLHGVRGRLEPVGGHPKGAAVYVDYAHTPAGLENVLQALRPHVQGRLFCVFGCGGDRDARKRPLMGRAVYDLADEGIVTDDNPRSEDPALIRAAVLKGHPDLREIGDRRQAIRTAIAEIGAGDVLVIAGKGHEAGQTIQGVVHPFDDVTEAVAAIKDLKHAV